MSDGANSTLGRRRLIQFEKVVAESTFQAGEIRVEGIGLEVRLRRQAGATP